MTGESPPRLDEAGVMLDSLSLDERDELLESLVIAICTNPASLPSTLAAYIRDHAFAQVVRQLKSGPQH